jgi:hypothetical protein
MKSHSTAIANTIRFLSLVTLLCFLRCGESISQSTSAFGQLNVVIIDSLSEEETPVRVRITRDHHVVKNLPESAVAAMYGVWDHADGYGFQPDSSFYTSGNFTLTLQEGNYAISLSKGMEYIDRSEVIHVSGGATATRTIKMMRWINMPAKGWYSADSHIHLRRSPREDPLLLKWIQAEDVHVGVLLKMGDFWATYYDQYAWGENGLHQNGQYLLTSGQEDPRTPELGHALGFGASGYVRNSNEYYYYDKVFDKLHERGGITGYAHHAETFHGYRGLMIDGLRGKVDAMEILQYCVDESALHFAHYYHMLDLGYAVTAIAGSDFPWCGKDHSHGQPENARIGNVRFYSFVEGKLTYDAWKNSVKAGHTFVSSGPMVALTVNGKIPGDTLRVHKGEKLIVRATAFGHPQQTPLNRVELIVHGKVVATAASDGSPRSSMELHIEKEMSAEGGSWIAVRAYGAPGQAAHTTPVYVSVDGSGFQNASTLGRYLDLSEDYLKELEKDIQSVKDNPELQSWRYQRGLEKRISETRKVIEMLRLSKQKK